MMRTSNPALNDAVFRIHDVTSSTTMTLQGVVLKTAVLLSILVACAGVTWSMALQGMPAQAEAVGMKGMQAAPSAIYTYVMIGGIAGFILALVTCFKPNVSPYTSPLYAAAEGVFLGGISAAFNYAYPGVVVQAVGLTFGTLFALLAAYATGVIKASENFKLGVFAATGGIALFYLASIVLRLFHIDVPLINSAGPFGIAFSVFVVIIAALNLVLDFDFIENGCAQGAPKYMEWYAGFGLLVTLVWLYLEILRLLVKLRGRD
ncbi:MAG TPA: Bax inhibitor-1/YccA family protein [Pirellulales bacterium]|jgi:uncharacterized YccA/Bax inhibitor family protein